MLRILPILGIAILLVACSPTPAPLGISEPTPTPTVSPTPEPPPAWTGPCSRARYRVEAVYAHFGFDIRKWNPNKGRPIVREVDPLVVEEARTLIRKIVSNINERVHEQTGRDIKWACKGGELRVRNVLLTDYGDEHFSFTHTMRELGHDSPRRIYLGFVPTEGSDTYCGKASGGLNDTSDFVWKTGYATAYWSKGFPGCWLDSTPLHELFHVLGAPHVDDKHDLMSPTWDRWNIDPGDFDYYDENRAPCQAGQTCFVNTADAPYLTRKP